MSHAGAIVYFGCALACVCGSVLCMAGTWGVSTGYLIAWGVLGMPECEVTLGGRALSGFANDTVFSFPVPNLNTTSGQASSCPCFDQDSLDAVSRCTKSLNATLWIPYSLAPVMVDGDCWFRQGSAGEVLQSSFRLGPCGDLAISTLGLPSDSLERFLLSMALIFCACSTCVLGCMLAYAALLVWRPAFEMLRNCSCTKEVSISDPFDDL